MSALLIHFRVYYRLYLCILFFWLLRYAAGPALQGATSELGQDAYGWLDKFNDFVDAVMNVGKYL